MQGQSQKLRVLRKRSQRARENVVGSVRVQAFEADELEVEQEVAEMIEEPEQEVVQTIKAPELWKAPVARMY
jgi:hypothetical protein